MEKFKGILSIVTPVLLIISLAFFIAISVNSISNTFSDEEVIKSVTKDVMEIKDIVNEAIEEYEEENE